MNKATKKQINRRTEEEKLGLFQEWEKSGLSIASFCCQHGFADSLFYSCLKQYRPKNKIQPESEFISLQITPAPARVPNTPSLYAELIQSGGTSIKFYQPVTATYFRTFIS